MLPVTLTLVNHLPTLLKHELEVVGYAEVLLLELLVLVEDVEQHAVDLLQYRLLLVVLFLQMRKIKLFEYVL